MSVNLYFFFCMHVFKHHRLIFPKLEEIVGDMVFPLPRPYTEGNRRSLITPSFSRSKGYLSITLCVCVIVFLRLFLFEERKITDTASWFAYVLKGQIF